MHPEGPTIERKFSRMRTSTLPRPDPPKRRAPPLVTEAHSLGDVFREGVRVQEDDDPDDPGKGDRMPEHEPEDAALVSDLVRGRRGDDDGLRVDHLAHDAARAVRGA